MNITLGSDNSVAVSRGEKITRGQSRSKLIKVNWRLGESPPELPISNTKHIGVESLVVQVNITRPDGEYSGWQDMIKVDGEISYYYPLQKWDTEVSGKAQCQIRWFKAGDDGDDDDTTVQTSNQISFVIDNGVIAQTLLPTLADYTTWQAILAGMQNNAMRKYDATNIPNSAVYNADGKKSAPAIYFNVSNGDYSGLLVVSKRESNENIVQIETLFTDEGIFARTITFVKTEYNDNNNEDPDGTATAWKDITKQSFSSTQLNALNSGITSEKVSDYDSHIANKSNPHEVTKTQVGLGNVDNTSDLNKPISTATQTALNAKQNTLTFDNTPTAGSTNPVTSEGIKNAIDSAISSVYRYKGSVASYSNLPSTGLTVGDVYNVEDTGDNYAWTGSAWDKLAGTIDFSGYVPTSRTVAGNALSSDISAQTLTDSLVYCNDTTDIDYIMGE